jgi:DNA-binding MarR family transcriptional regulator
MLLPSRHEPLTTPLRHGLNAGLNSVQLRAWRGLIETSALLRHRLDQLLLADSGLSGSDYPILVTLHEVDTPTLRVSDLADRIGWENSRLSHQLARMERRGLIRRTPHASDRRGSEVGLTTQGRATYLAATTAHSRAVGTHFADVLTDRQLRQLGEIMETLDRHLKATTTPRARPE